MNISIIQCLFRQRCVSSFLKKIKIINLTENGNRYFSHQKRNSLCIFFSQKLNKKPLKTEKDSRNFNKLRL